jgi:hypothetical protein
MISIESTGRLGNKLNYFITGMYIHELKNQLFIPERIEGFVNTYHEHIGDVNTTQLRLSTLYSDFENLLQNISKSNTGFIIDNMIHKYFLFKEMDIKRYLKIDDSMYVKPGSDELVIHIRIGDYSYVNGNCIIDKELYFKCIDIEKNNINKVTILTDSPDSPFLDDFRTVGCEIRCGNALEDFSYIKNANKICISNSTYSWTAAYISEAENIYWPISCNKWPYFSNPGRNDADMRPLDKKNWIYI